MNWKDMLLVGVAVAGVAYFAFSGGGGVVVGTPPVSVRDPSPRHPLPRSGPPADPLGAAIGNLAGGLATDLLRQAGDALSNIFNGGNTTGGVAG